MENLEVTISAQTLLTAAGVLTAIGSIGGMIFWCFRFLQRNDRQDKAIAAIKKEQTLICYGVKACLQGLKEQGCDGPVSEALDKLDRHLNKAAHDEEEPG